MNITRSHFPDCECEWYNSYNSRVVPSIKECDHPAYHSVTTSLYYPLKLVENETAYMRAWQVMADQKVEGGEYPILTLFWSPGHGYVDEGVARGDRVPFYKQMPPDRRAELVRDCKAICKRFGYTPDMERTFWRWERVRRIYLYCAPFESSDFWIVLARSFQHFAMGKGGKQRLQRIERSDRACQQEEVELATE